MDFQHLAGRSESLCLCIQHATPTNAGQKASCRWEDGGTRAVAANKDSSSLQQVEAAVIPKLRQRVLAYYLMGMHKGFRIGYKYREYHCQNAMSNIKSTTSIASRKEEWPQEQHHQMRLNTGFCSVVCLQLLCNG